MAARKAPAKTTVDAQRPHAQKARAKAVAEDGIARTAASSKPLDRRGDRGSQVRNLRHKLDLTGPELAEQAGLSASMLSKIENGAGIGLDQNPRSAVAGAQRAADDLFPSYEEQRDCSFVHAGRGVTIERRGTKAGHQYQLLGHSISGEVVVEPYLITLTEEAQALHPVPARSVSSSSICSPGRCFIATPTRPIRWLLATHCSSTRARRTVPKS